MATWVLTDESCNINYKQNGVSHRTLPKELTVLEIVLAGEPLNDTSVDCVFVRYEGKYAIELPYNDTTIGATGYGSAELLRIAILALLNSNPCAGGGGGGVGTLQQVTTAGATTDQTILGDAGGATNYSLSPSGLSINVVAGGSTQYFSNQALLGNSAGASSSILNDGTAAFSDGAGSILNIDPTSIADNGAGSGIEFTVTGGGLCNVHDDHGKFFMGGVPNGNNLHDNALAQGDSTVQEIRSGTYTPTSSNNTNLAADPTMTKAQWFRVGNVVTVSGLFTADPTAAATPSSFEIDLPVPSVFTTREDCCGVAFCGIIAGMGAAIRGETTNFTAEIVWSASDITSKQWSYTFTYEVL